MPGGGSIAEGKQATVQIVVVFWLSDKWKMWDIFRRFIGKHNALTTLSFESHYQMAYTMLQMYLDSNMLFDVFTLLPWCKKSVNFIFIHIK